MREPTRIPYQAASRKQNIRNTAVRHSHGPNRQSQQKNADRRPSRKADQAAREIKVHRNGVRKH